MGVLMSKRRRVWLNGVVVWFNYNTLNPPGMNLLHATQDGLPVLREEKLGWRTFHGVVIRTRSSQTFIHFWRLPSYLRKSR
jgi:hypothetical protein